MGSRRVVAVVPHRKLSLSTVLSRARAGETDAIANLIEQALEADGALEVSVIHQERCLQVTLQGSTVSGCHHDAQAVYAALLCLNIPATDCIQVQGIPEAGAEAVWTHRWPLAELRSEAADASPEPGPSQAAPQRPMSLRQAGLFALTAFGIGFFGIGSFLITPWRPQAAPPRPRITTNTLPPPQPAAALNTPDSALIVNAVGNLALGSDYPGYQFPADPDTLFRSMQPFLRKDADLLFGNFESTMTDQSYAAIEPGPVRRIPSAYADVFKTAGFDVLSIANDRADDLGTPGFEDTAQHLQASGIQAVGHPGQIVYAEVNRLRTAFIGFSDSSQANSIYDLEAAEALVKIADQQADIIVISVHVTAGSQVDDSIKYFRSAAGRDMVEFARHVVDAGADLVIGHGSQLPRAVDIYAERLIAYSLGTFLEHHPANEDAASEPGVLLQVGLNEQGAFVAGRILPVARDRNGLPYLDDYFESVTLVRRLTREAFPQSLVTINDMGYIVRSSFVD